MLGKSERGTTGYRRSYGLAWGGVLCQAEERLELGLTDLGLGSVEHGSWAWANLGLVARPDLGLWFGYDLGLIWVGCFRLAKIG